MELREYASLDAVGLRELIRAGEVTEAEVEEVARRALALADTELNALTLPLFEPALEHEPGGPLAGVPFVIKDSGPSARGVPFTLGSRSIQGAVALVDHDLMTRFREAGLVTLGQTTAPELGLSFATESARYGPTRKPVGAGAWGRRFQWRRGRAGRRGRGAAGARQRRGRVVAGTRLLLRAGRPQAQPWPYPQRPVLGTVQCLRSPGDQPAARAQPRGPA